MVDFVVVTTAYNAGPWIDRCVASVRRQSHGRYRMVIVDDASGDGTADRVRAAKLDGRFTLIANGERRGSMANIVRAINTTPMDDQTVVVSLDGDDWLASDEVLAYLAQIYEDPDAWLTYGQFQFWDSGEVGFCAPLHDTRTYRKSNLWVTSHLKTFRRHLWNRISDADLRDVDGQYYAVVNDRAFLYPMIEMAGLRRIRFVDRITCIYNVVNPIADNKVNARLTWQVTQRIQAKQEYDELPLVSNRILVPV